VRGTSPSIISLVSGGQASVGAATGLATSGAAVSRVSAEPPISRRARRWRTAVAGGAGHTTPRRDADEIGPEPSGTSKHDTYEAFAIRGSNNRLSKSAETR